MHRLCQHYDLQRPVASAEIYCHFNEGLDAYVWLSKRSGVSGQVWGQESRSQGGIDETLDGEESGADWAVNTLASRTARERTQLSGCCCYDMMSFVAGGNSRSAKIPFIAQFTPEVYQTEGGWWWWITPLLWDSAKKILNTSDYTKSKDIFFLSKSEDASLSMHISAVYFSGFDRKSINPDKLIFIVICFTQN